MLGSKPVTSSRFLLLTSNKDPEVHDVDSYDDTCATLMISTDIPMTLFTMNRFPCMCVRMFILPPAHTKLEKVTTSPSNKAKLLAKVTLASAILFSCLNARVETVALLFLPTFRKISFPEPMYFPYWVVSTAIFIL